MVDTLFSTPVSYLCHYTGEEGKKERAESPDGALSFAVTLDKSTPKTAAPETVTPARRRAPCISTCQPDPAARPVSNLRWKIKKYVQMHLANFQVTITSKPILIELIISYIGHKDLFSLKEIYILQARALETLFSLQKKV